MARRDGRVANWVVALAFLGLLVAAGFAIVQLVDDGSKIAKSVSPRARGREAAQRIRTVIASGDLGDLGGQSGVTIAVRCTPNADSPGPPALALVYADPDGAQARLRARGWDEQSMLFGPNYQKQFDTWSARVAFTKPSRALLTVSSDTILRTDCLTFRDGLRNEIAAPELGG